MNKITINKALSKEDGDIYDRAKAFKSGNDYLKYLFDLDRLINGRDDVINGYVTAINYVKAAENQSKVQINKRIDMLIDDLAMLINYIIKNTPEEAKLSAYDPSTDLEMIPDDDTLFTSKMIVDELIGLRNLLKNRK